MLIIYLLFWIVLCEKLTIEVTVIGTVLICGVYFLNTNLNKFMYEYRNYNIKKFSLWIKYINLLLYEVFIANFHVAAIVLSPKMNISTCIVRFKSNLTQNFTKTVLANSITLTPGTITVSVEGDEFTIHCLREDYAKGLINSKFEKILSEIER